MKKLCTPLILFFLFSFVFSCNKEETLKVVAGSGSSQPKIRVANDQVNGRPVVVAGTQEFEFIVAFGRQMPDGVLLVSSFDY